MTRRYNTVLAYDAVAKAWKLPAGAVNPVIHVNGLRYLPWTDYSVTGTAVKALSTNMQPTDTVSADYDL